MNGAGTLASPSSTYSITMSKSSFFRNNRNRTPNPSSPHSPGPGGIVGGSGSGGGRSHAPTSSHHSRASNSISISAPLSPASRAVAAAVSASASTSSLPRLQPSIASAMRGYNAPSYNASSTFSSGPATTINANNYHSHSSASSPIRTGGLGGGGTGGHSSPRAAARLAQAQTHTHMNTVSNNILRSPPSSAGGLSSSTTSPSWGLGSPSTFRSLSYNSTGLPATAAAGTPTAASGAGTPASGSTWSRAHRPQQASSADLDYMVASIGLNRFAMSPHSDHDYDHHSSGANTATATAPSADMGDIYVRMHSPNYDDQDGDGAHGLEFDSDGEFARAFSPPRYAGYASLPDDDGPLSAVSAPGNHDDRFTPLPTMRSRPRRETSHEPEDHPRIDARALASPPPHQRNVNHAHATTEESHESGLSGSSAMTGITDSSAFRPQLSSSTSTVITQATAITSPIMGSDEMLMALMASQAAVDCDALPTGGWEEVESWKKELSLLSTRLDAVQARHQREVRILTAARTLQKLNQTNKRLSKQTMESLEQSERRVEKAEKDVLVLRDREAALRRRLMEHWAGIMAWEVRRLERSHSESQSRLEMHVRAAESDRESLIERLAAIDTGDHMPPPKMIDNGDRDRDRDLAAAHSRDRELQERISELENKLQSERVYKAELESERELSSSRMKSLEVDRERRTGRIAELEDMVLELGRRERSLEDGARDHDTKLYNLERERDEWHGERARHAKERETWEAERAQFSQKAMDSDAWTAEREILVSERDALHSERSTFETQTRQHGATGLAWEAEKGRLTTERDQLQRDYAELQARHAQDHDAWMDEREQMVAERELLEAATSAQTGSRDAWTDERAALLAKQDRMAADLEALAVEHDRLQEESRDMQIKQAQAVAIAAEKENLEGEHAMLKKEYSTLLASTDRDASSASMTNQRLAATLGAMLGRGAVPEGELVPALEEVRTLLDTRSSELDNMHDRYTEEIERTAADRDAWKAKADEGGMTSHAAQAEMTSLVRKIRTQNEQIAELQAQVHAGSTARSAGAGPDPVLETKLQRLWSTLPSPVARAEAGLTSPSVVSPNAPVNFAILQRAYAGSTEQYTNVDDLLERVAGLIEDGRLMVERMQRMDVDKMRHKANAARAAQLVSDSRASLEKYQEQVEDLEERLERQGHARSDSKSLAQVSALEREIDILQRELDQAHGENSRLRADADDNKETIDMFSARTLVMADEHEREKNLLTARLAKDLEALKAQLQAAEEGADEERNRAHLQSAQMMGEMMDLQDEIAKLRSGRR